jgi:hypothetical protein
LIGRWKASWDGDLVIHDKTTVASEAGELRLEKSKIEECESLRTCP